jgi:hypothetical protein
VLETNLTLTEFTEIDSLDAGRERDYPLSLHWDIDIEFFRSIGIPQIRDRNLERALCSIFTEAVLAYEVGRSVSYSRSHDDYSGMGRYHGWGPYTYKNVKAGVAIGVEHGFLTTWTAPRGTYGKRRLRSTFTATSKLIAALSASWIRHELKGLIRLKDEARKLTPFKDTDRTRQLEREIQSLNEFLGAIQADIDHPDVVKLANHWVIANRAYRVGTMAMYRVFNRTFWLGGRLYNGYQNVKKTHRPALLLNGEPTINLDVRQLHAAMLYDNLGLRPPEDVYSVDGFERDEGKLALNVSINCGGGQRGAVAALLKKRNELKDDGTPEWIRSPDETAALVEALWIKNERIKAALGSGAGRGLMYRDSKFMIDIIKGCRKAGIPILPLHDGAQIPSSKEGHGLEIFEAAAHRAFNDLKACRVRVSGHSVRQIPPSSPLPLSSPSFPGSCSVWRNRHPASGGEVIVSMESPVLVEAVREPPEKSSPPEDRQPVQMTFLGMLEDRAPEHDAVAEANVYEGGIIPDPVIRLMRDMRRQRGERQEDVARKLGISRPQLANAERQRSGLGREPAARLKRWIEGDVKAA